MSGPSVRSEFACSPCVRVPRHFSFLSQWQFQAGQKCKCDCKWWLVWLQGPMIELWRVQVATWALKFNCSQIYWTFLILRSFSKNILGQTDVLHLGLRCHVMWDARKLITSFQRRSWNIKCGSPPDTVGLRHYCFDVRAKQEKTSHPDDLQLPCLRRCVFWDAAVNFKCHHEPRQSREQFVAALPTERRWVPVMNTTFFVCVWLVMGLHPNEPV